MTEAEWLCCANSRLMLDHLFDAAPFNGRKVTLFAVACCRRIWHLLTDERGRRAVEVAEQHADGRATSAQRADALEGATAASEDAASAVMQAAGAEALALGLPPLEAAFHGCNTAHDASSAYDAAAAAASGKDYLDAMDAAKWAVLARAHTVSPCPFDIDLDGDAQQRAAVEAAERAGQAALLRCIFGNPFRSPSCPNAAWLAWNDGTVRRMAQAIYEDNRFEDMPILADALEEAGCDDQAMLGHCREQGSVHARGCWVLDLLLGKE